MRFSGSGSVVETEGILVIKVVVTKHHENLELVVAGSCSYRILQRTEFVGNVDMAEKFSVLPHVTAEYDIIGSVYEEVFQSFIENSFRFQPHFGTFAHYVVVEIIFVLGVNSLPLCITQTERIIVSIGNMSDRHGILLIETIRLSRGGFRHGQSRQYHAEYQYDCRYEKEYTVTFQIRFHNAALLFEIFTF